VPSRRARVAFWHGTPFAHSPTWDEPGHLAAGVSHWYFGNFDLYRVNPPLVRMIASLPILPLSPEFDWPLCSTRPGARAEFDLARDWTSRLKNECLWFFTLARWACIPLSLIGAYVCYRWARELYGDLAGTDSAGIMVLRSQHSGTRPIDNAGCPARPRLPSRLPMGFGAGSKNRPGLEQLSPESSWDCGTRQDDASGILPALAGILDCLELFEPRTVIASRARRTVYSIGRDASSGRLPHQLRVRIRGVVPPGRRIPLRQQRAWRANGRFGRKRAKAATSSSAAG